MNPALGASFQLNDAFNISLTYLVDTGLISNPSEKAGLFDGQFGALAQLTFTPNERLKLGFTYVRYYSPEPGRGINVSGNTGSSFAQTPFGNDAATSANAYGIEAQYRFSDRLGVGLVIHRHKLKVLVSLLIKGREQRFGIMSWLCLFQI